MDTQPRLAAADPGLRPLADLACARRTVAAFVPTDERSARSRERILALVESHPDVLERACRPGHLTASALVLDSSRRRALLCLHEKLGRWLQLGGHCDGDANLAGVALREAREESGIDDLSIDPRPVDLDVHGIPARADESEHLHLDVRFFVFAPAEARPRPSSESRALRWVAPAELLSLDPDPSLARLFELAFGG